MVGTPRRKQTIIQTDVQDQLDKLKQDLLKEFALLLAQLQANTEAAGSQKIPEDLKQLADDPVFIPANIVNNDKVADQKVTVSEDSEDSGTLDDAAEALRRARDRGKG